MLKYDVKFRIAGVFLSHSFPNPMYADEIPNHFQHSSRKYNKCSNK